MQAARLPHMDAVARTGVVGMGNNVPDALTPASDVATLSLFGYDPLKVYTGRAPLETVAMGIRLGPDDWAVRCNLVTVIDGNMFDFTAGHIDSADGAKLMNTVQERLGGPVRGGTLEFFAGVQYRNILVFRADGPGSAPFTPDTTAQPPHDIPDKPIEAHLPKGPGSELLIDLMRRSVAILADHPTNRDRIARGKKPATTIWLWGQGCAPVVEPFREVYGCNGAIVSAVDLVRGVGILIGWTRIDAPGATGYLDTDYASKGRTGIEALKSHDLVCVHVEAPDEASHEGRADEKVLALERIDTHIVGPMLAALPRYGDYRILISPDHRTPVSTRAHQRGAVPFAAAGAGIVPDAAASYDEVSGSSTGLRFDPGWTLMAWFLGLTHTEKR